MVSQQCHVLVDTLGLLVEVLIHSAGMHNRDGGKLLAAKAKLNEASCTKGYADGMYAGDCIPFTKDVFHVDFESVKRSDQHTCVVLPKRWMSERTLSWMNR